MFVWKQYILFAELYRCSLLIFFRPTFASANTATKSSTRRTPCSRIWKTFTWRRDRNSFAGWWKVDLLNFKIWLFNTRCLEKLSRYRTLFLISKLFRFQNLRRGFRRKESSHSSHEQESRQVGNALSLSDLWIPVLDASRFNRSFSRGTFWSN